ncbi:endonuclease/exonuclease/phosphatase family protein [Demequina subtropica]|uniref:endonuclease/exonuclease/phosphatase family protein n=1 Tax=Demequina subtropica TaxID=1638989 RepID=UPI0007812589|nr:endonuclease/exonuclease/phosphatase family protein [Demequina subtropica]
MGEPGEGARVVGASTPRETAVRVLAFIARVIAWALLLAALVPVLVRLTGFEAGPLAIAVSMLPWATLAALIAVMLAAAARAWNLMVAALVTWGLGVLWMAPLFTGPAASGEPVLTVATVSLANNGVRTDEVLALAREGDVDLLAATELTPLMLEWLREKGIDDLMPYSAVYPEDGKFGTGLWSTLPIEDATLETALTAATVRAEIAFGTGRITVVVPHPESPGLLEHGVWEDDLEALQALLESEEGTVIVAGDLNTTRDHRAFREIEALGYVDAVDSAGAGFMGTYPDGLVVSRVWPGPAWVTTPLVAIDHVLVRGSTLQAVEAHTVSLQGSDHRALVVRLASG